jgi:NTE family protein
MVAVDDGLAKPISFEARHGAGYRRSLVLGGGGVVFVAWLTGYLTELARRGVRVDAADRIVGTSAGALLAGAVAAGRLERVARLLRLLAGRPALIGRLAPATGLHASQERARDLFERARDAEPATIRAIGAAALAAATPSPGLLPASALLVLATRRWPDDRLVVSAVDAYTGERLALGRGCGVPLLRAVAASASVPGLFAPQRLLDRRCMDGGVSGTGIHADLVAGAGRALVFSIADALPEPRLTIATDSVSREIAALRASGTVVAVRHSRLSPAIDLMDPAEVPDALALGTLQAGEDAAALADFWRR